MPENQTAIPIHELIRLVRADLESERRHAAPVPQDYFTEKQAGLYLGYGTGSMRDFRRLGIDPPYFVIPVGQQGSVRYRRSDLVEWVTAGGLKGTNH